MGYVKLKIRTPYDLQNEIIGWDNKLAALCEKQPTTEFNFGNPFVDEQCRMQHFFNPRPPVQRELLKLLLPMQSWRGSFILTTHPHTTFFFFCFHATSVVSLTSSYTLYIISRHAR